MPVKKFTFTLFISLFLTFCYSQNLIFDWNHIIDNGSWYNMGKSIKVDTAGYIYVAGSIEDTLVFIDTTINCEEYSTAFLAKLNSDGDLIWFKYFKGAREISSLCFDHDNNLYAVGIYYNRVDMGDTILITNNTDTVWSMNMFIVKYNTDGNLLWAKNTTGVWYSSGSGNGPLKKIAVDNDNNLIITGRCINEIEYFDTNIVITTLDSALVTYPYPYWYYYHASIAFLAKYNPEGEKIWVRKMGTGAYCKPYSVEIDHSNNILIIGYYSDTISFDSITITPTGYWSIFITKFNNNGKVQWVEKAGGNSSDNNGFDIKTDSINNVYITGEMSGSNVEFGGNIVFLGSYLEAFIAKYDSIGNFLWVIPIGTSHHTKDDPPNNFGTSIYIDNNNIYLSGSFNDSLNFAGTILENNFGCCDMFLLKMDLDGNVLRAGQYSEGEGWLCPQEITMDKDNNIYFIGYYQVNAYYYKIIIGKTSGDIPVGCILLTKDRPKIYVYPNPSNGYFYIITNTNNEANAEIRIYDLYGKLVYSNLVKLTGKQVRINTGYLPGGVYILRITGNSLSKTLKIIIK